MDNAKTSLPEHFVFILKGTDASISKTVLPMISTGMQQSEFTMQRPITTGIQTIQFLDMADNFIPSASRHPFTMVKTFKMSNMTLLSSLSVCSILFLCTVFHMKICSMSAS